MVAHNSIRFINEYVVITHLLVIVNDPGTLLYPPYGLLTANFVHLGSQYQSVIQLDAWWFNLLLKIHAEYVVVIGWTDIVGRLRSHVFYLCRGTKTGKLSN